MKLELINHAGKIVGYNLVPENPAEEKALKAIMKAYHDGVAILEDYGNFYNPQEWGKTKNLKFLREKYASHDIKTLTKLGEITTAEVREEPEEYFVCSECGSKNVQIEVWIYSNGGGYAREAGDGQVWCEDCNGEVTLIMKKVKKKKSKKNG